MKDILVFSIFCFSLIVIVSILLILLLLSIISAEMVTAISTVISSIIAAIAAFYAWRQYNKHLDEERTNLLCKYNQRYSSDTNIEEVITWMLRISILNENGDIIGAEPSRVNYSPGIHKKEMFMRFFEELYLHIEDNKIDERESCRLFSYYALKFDKIKDFRLDITDYLSVEEENSAQLDKNKKKLLKYWSNYRKYVKEMSFIWETIEKECN